MINRLQSLKKLASLLRKCDSSEPQFIPGIYIYEWVLKKWSGMGWVGKDYEYVDRKVREL